MGGGRGHWSIPSPISPLGGVGEPLTPPPSHPRPEGRRVGGEGEKVGRRASCATIFVILLSSLLTRGRDNTHRDVKSPPKHKRGDFDAQLRRKILVSCNKKKTKINKKKTKINTLMLSLEKTTRKMARQLCGHETEEGFNDTSQTIKPHITKPHSGGEVGGGEQAHLRPERRQQE